MPQPRPVPQEQPAPREEVAQLLLEDFARDTLLFAEPTTRDADFWSADIGPEHLRVSINSGDDIVLLDRAGVEELADFLDRWLGVDA